MADRDRSATEARLIAAAKALLAEAGPEALGVNAVARRAGCDKQLVYRYFGGLDGLLAAVGAGLADQLIARLDAHRPPAGASYASFVRAMLAGLLAAYREVPALARMKGAEWSAGPALAALVEARGRALGDWVAAHRPGEPPEGVDVPALNALLIGGVEAAALSALGTGRVAGMPLADAADWARLDAALDRITAAVY